MPNKLFKFNSIVLFCVAFLTTAQTVTIQFKSNQTPLALLEVLLFENNSHKYLMTDSNANLRFAISPKTTTYQITVLDSNYKNRAHTLNASTSDTSILLFSEITDLKEVVFTQKQEKLNEQFSTYTVTMKEGQKYAATFDDPTRMVATTASTSQSSGGEIYNYLIVRGNNPQGVQWRVNGLEVPSLSHFSQFGATAGALSILQTGSLSSVSLQTGNFTSDVGNATAGVFDMKLKTSVNDSLRHKISLGVLGLIAGSNGYLDKSKKVYYNTNIRYASLGLLNKLGFSYQNRPLPTYGDANFHVGVKSKKFEEVLFWTVAGKSLLSLEGTKNIYAVGVLGTSIKKKISSRSNFALNALISTLKNNNLYAPNFISQTKELYVEKISRAKLDYYYKPSTSTILNIGAIIGDRFYNYQRNGSIGFKKNKHSLTFENYIDLSKIYNKIQFSYGVHSTYYQLINKLTVEPRIKVELHQNTKIKYFLALGKYSRLEILPSYLNAYKFSTDTSGRLISTKIRENATQSIHLSTGVNLELSKTAHLKLEIYHQSVRNFPRFSSNDSLSYINFLRPYSEAGSTMEYTGQAYTRGMEALFEKKTNTCYITASGSLLDSRYLVYNKWESTRFNVGFVLSGMFGKEWKVRNRNVFSINYRLAYNGGIYSLKPYDATKTYFIPPNYYYYFPLKMPNYLRQDVQIYYSLNKSKYQLTYKLDILNFTNRQTLIEYNNQFEKDSKKIYYLGITPSLSVSVEF